MLVSNGVIFDTRWTHTLASFSARSCVPFPHVLASRCIGGARSHPVQFVLVKIDQVEQPDNYGRVLLLTL